MTLLPPFSAAQWQALGGAHTAQEIAQQPAVWRELARQLRALPASRLAALQTLLEDHRTQVILTGAGTSSYIGELAADTLNTAVPAQVRAIATTSLLSHPALYVEPGRPLLLVSFARSGNSPESQAVVELVRKLAPGARFLHITCNAQGRLAAAGAGRDDTHTFVLPAASCDQGFAMTSSFTAMLLAALSLLGPDPLDVAARRIDTLAALAARWLDEQAASWHDIGHTPVSRIVYLGSGALEGLAREAALKVLELSAGLILAVPHTPLGFRHGPKSMLNQHTLVVLFHSQDPHARRYEDDLLQELRRDRVAGAVLALDGAALGAPAGLSDAWLAVAYAVFAQTLALHQSVRLGLPPDNPFPDGTVNRVVQGVTVYDYAA
ncbi:SIS domain-containing protein [Duganella sp. FT92W]|uniref:SIS domain-containing protein n=1 Tax=Pseudoduganella rivuli TaxID=2666085 RepID=A0A7X2LRT5_9BURK|nr:SIS domain-containing protein [Pseudoduganella rivuli]MRV70262.1 SIS domain-containing protein [Pseudoduganella rivuli]